MDGSRISTLATALADPTRAMTVSALLSGTAHTSGELARAAGVAASTMSSHLSKLIDAGLVSVEPAGRFRYYRIASREIADLLEKMDALELPETVPPHRPTPGQEISYARSCYDHLAGRLGVAVHDRCIEEGWVTVAQGTATLTDGGDRFFTDLGLDLDRLRTLRRPMLRIDLDWTERRDHLAGSLPAALMTHMIDDGWFTRRTEQRILRPTTKGRRELQSTFGITP